MTHLKVLIGALPIVHGSLACFVHADGRLENQRIFLTTMSQSKFLETAMYGVDIAIYSRSNTAIELFALDNQQHLLSSLKPTPDPGAQWGNWQSAPGAGELLRISATSLADQRAALWAHDPSHQLWGCMKTSADPDATWLPWSKYVDAPPVHNLRVARLSDGRPQLFIIDANQVVHTSAAMSADTQRLGGRGKSFPVPTGSA
jgi:hypothetical protein